MASRPTGDLTDAHARPADEVVRALDVDPARGLSSAEVAERLRTNGPNELDAPQRPSVLAAIREAASEPFVLLLAAAGAGAVFLGEVRDGLLVLGGLLPIIGADVVTTYRSERALEALRTAAAPRAHAMRDGRRTEIPASEVVPGDILVLAAGDVVPADARIL
ncbi:MAG: cation-transporting P-type ATPase, partial [Candidatus Limnocylindria bacterium]